MLCWDSCFVKKHPYQVEYVNHYSWYQSRQQHRKAVSNSKKKSLPCISTENSSNSTHIIDVSANSVKNDDNIELDKIRTVSGVVSKITGFIMTEYFQISIIFCVIKVLLLQVIEQLQREKQERVQNKEPLNNLEKSLSCLGFLEQRCDFLSNTAMFLLCFTLGNTVVDNLNDFLFLGYKFLAKNQKVHSTCLILYGKIPYQNFFLYVLQFVPSLAIARILVSLILIPIERFLNCFFCLLIPESSLKNLKDLLIILKSETFLANLIEVLNILKLLLEKRVNQTYVNKKNCIEIAIVGLENSF